MHKIDMTTWPRAELFHIVTLPKTGTLGMSLEVSHRFIDGYHLGQFYQNLQKSMDEL